MQAGKRKDFVEVQLKSNKRDGYGAKIKSWSKVFGVKANVRYLSGSDLIKAGLSANVLVITVLMRRDSRIGSEHSLFIDGNRFDITNIRPSNNKRDIIITAESES